MFFALPREISVRVIERALSHGAFFIYIKSYKKEAKRLALGLRFFWKIFTKNHVENVTHRSDDDQSDEDLSRKVFLAY